MEEHNDGVGMLDIKIYPFSDLTNPRETQLLLDGMMDVANMREQVRKLKLAIARKKVKELNDLVAELGKSILDKQNIKTQCIERIDVLSKRYKDLKEDFAIRRSTFETTITAIEVKAASLKMESDELRKITEVNSFIQEYCGLKNEIERLKERKLNAQGEIREAIQRDIDEKNNSLNTCYEEGKQNENIQKFIDCNDKIDAQGRLIKDNRDSLSKLNSKEDELDKKFQIDIENARQEVRNQRSIISVESNQGGLKKLINILKQKLGIGKSQERQETYAFENITSGINDTITYIESDCSKFIKDNEEMQKEEINKLSPESKTIAESGLSSAKIVNKLAEWFSKNGKTEKDQNQEHSDHESDNMNEHGTYLVEQVV